MRIIPILDVETAAMNVGGELLACVPYPHEADSSRLALTIVKLNNGRMPYVCWTYNSDNGGGFTHGDYNETYMGAVVDFALRLGKLRS